MILKMFLFFCQFRENRFGRSLKNHAQINFHCANTNLTGDILSFFVFSRTFNNTRFECYFFVRVWHVQNLRVNSFAPLPRDWNPVWEQLMFLLSQVSRRHQTTSHSFSFVCESDRIHLLKQYFNCIHFYKFYICLLSFYIDIFGVNEFQ